MESIRDLEDLLLPADDQVLLPGNTGDCRIVVFKQFRFIRALCIELYDAGLTQGGKIKNPLSAVSAADAMLLATTDPEALLFYAAVNRFQHPPTGVKSAAEIRALKTIIKNPLGFRFFYHDASFSENVSAGSLREIKVGAVLQQLVLRVQEAGPFYQLSLQVGMSEQFVAPAALTILHDYFLLQEGRAWLVSNLTQLRLLQVFSARPQIQVPAAQFAAFQEKVLTKLEEKITVVHEYIVAATKAELEAAGLIGAQEYIIYLSDLGQYVMINPVMRYGSVEVPVRSKKMLYLPDARNRLMAMARDEKAEDAFIALLLRQHPHFMEQLEEGLTYFYLHRDRFLNEDWFLQAFTQWRAAGISIFGFNQLKGNKLNGYAGEISVQVQSGLNWFNVNLRVQFGSQQATLKQLQQAVRNKGRFVQLDDGTLGILPEAWIDRMGKFFFAADIVGDELLIPRTKFDSVAELFAPDEMDAPVKDTLRLLAEKLNQVSTIEPVAPPADLKATLRGYQQEGLSWLYFLHQHQLGGVLADDMGLGKTLQVIAFMLQLKADGYTDTHLLVVPTSLLFNWQQELRRFAPSLRCITLHGAGRNKDTEAFDDADLVLTSYGTLLADLHHLRRYPFGYVFLDEAQQIKNPGSQRYHAASLLRSKNRIAITGTPMENNTMDLYAQLSFVCPGLLGTKKSFQDLYLKPIDQFEDSRRTAELQRKVAPFILRRTKEAVMPELPDKTEQVLYCQMSEKQRAVYGAYEQDLREYLEGKMQDEIMRSSIHVLRGLTQLRQICNDPRLLKAESLQGEGSAKIDLLLEQLPQKAAQHKILVFSQFVSMLDLLAAELDKIGLPYVTLTGATRNREAVVAQFQDDPGVRVFLLSLKAGGVGLNLTAASYVYLADPWWNPAVEAQAIDRAYRIGQHRNVQAIRLICKDTVEEKILLLQQQKKALTEGMISSGQDFFSSLTPGDWQTILS
jgi:superfamily II DNA or RNA helicase